MNAMRRVEVLENMDNQLQEIRVRVNWFDEIARVPDATFDDPSGLYVRKLLAAEPRALEILEKDLNFLADIRDYDEGVAHLDILWEVMLIGKLVVNPPSAGRTRLQDIKRILIRRQMSFCNLVIYAAFIECRTRETFLPAPEQIVRYLSDADEDIAHIERMVRRLVNALKAHALKVRQRGKRGKRSARSSQRHAR